MELQQNVKTTITSFLTDNGMTERTGPFKASTENENFYQTWACGAEAKPEGSAEHMVAAMSPASLVPLMLNNVKQASRGGKTLVWRRSPEFKENVYTDQQGETHRLYTLTARFVFE